MTSTNSIRTPKAPDWASYTDVQLALTRRAQLRADLASVDDRHRQHCQTIVNGERALAPVADPLAAAASSFIGACGSGADGVVCHDDGARGELIAEAGNGLPLDPAARTQALTGQLGEVERFLRTAAVTWSERYAGGPRRFWLFTPASDMPQSAELSPVLTDLVLNYLRVEEQVEIEAWELPSLFAEAPLHQAELRRELAALEQAHGEFIVRRGGIARTGKARPRYTRPDADAERGELVPE